jgi:hypothetical protein
MSVHRLAKYRQDDPFTRVPNTAIADPNLDLKALGLLVLMLSKPDGWTFRERNLAESARVGREAVRTAMAKLIAAGYVVRSRVAEDGRPPITVTAVYDRPIQPKVGNPEVGKPDRRETRPLSNDGVLVTKDSSKRRRPVPDGWQPSPAVSDEMAQRYPTLQIGQEAEKFTDWHGAKGNLFVDHDKAFRNWCRKAAEYAAKNSRTEPGKVASIGTGGIYL